MGTTALELFFSRVVIEVSQRGVWKGWAPTRLFAVVFPLVIEHTPSARRDLLRATGGRTLVRVPVTESPLDLGEFTRTIPRFFVVVTLIFSPVVLRLTTLEKLTKFKHLERPFPGSDDCIVPLSLVVFAVTPGFAVILLITRCFVKLLDDLSLDSFLVGQLVPFLIDYWLILLCRPFVSTVL